jgi:hypothetical protein
VFYRLATAKLPFKGETPFAMAQSQVNEMPTPVALMRSDLPTWVEQIVVKALSKAPEQRFQSAVEFHEAFARCLAGLSMTTTGAMEPASAVTAILTPARPTPTGTISSRFQMAAPGAPTGTASPQPDVPGRDAAAHPPAAAAPAPASPTNTSAVLVALGAAALVILLAGVGSLWWIRLRSESPQSSTSSTPATSDQTAAAPSAIPTSPAPGGAVSPPAAVSTPASPVPAPPQQALAGRSGAAGATSPPGTAAAQRGTAADSSTRGAANTRGRGASPDASSAPIPVAPPAVAAPAESRTPAESADAQVVFADVKVLMISGRRAQDRDALLSLVSGQVTVLNRQGGTIIASTPYKSIERATYARARNPKWDPSFFSPPADLDMPGILPTARHWLVLQGRGSYLILQLNGNTWQKVLEVIEGRTGVKVQRN